MSSRLLRKIMGVSQGHVIVAGSFGVNGSSALDATKVQGKGFTVAYTSTGLYTVTFADKYPSLIAATATLQLATASDKYVQIGTYVASTGVMKINCWDASDAALADAGAADDNNRINFVCHFGNLSFQ